MLVGLIITPISNHTLEGLGLYYFGTDHKSRGDHPLRSLERLNKDTNQSNGAIRKILKYHPNMDMDMEPLFEWNLEEDGQDLKALPYVVSWFGRAEEAVAEDDDQGELLHRPTKAIGNLSVCPSLISRGTTDFRYNMQEILLCIHLFIFQRQCNRFLDLVIK